jgi:hypothetical protein
VHHLEPTYTHEPKNTSDILQQNFSPRLAEVNARVPVLLHPFYNKECLGAQ